MSIVATGGSGVGRRQTPGQWEYRKEELQLHMALWIATYPRGRFPDSVLA